MKGAYPTTFFLAAAFLGSMSVGVAYAAAGAAVSDLRDTKWSLASINDAPPAAQSPPTISFLHEYRISGWTGCDAFFGIYGEDRSKIAVRTVVSAKTSCAGPVNVQEEAFLNILASTPNLSLRPDGTLLVESAKAGEMILTRSNK